jgi:hypothetical protein
MNVGCYEHHRVLRNPRPFNYLMADKILLYSLLGIVGEIVEHNIALEVVAFCVLMF